MTALTEGLREWWRHRNDPPAMLPDPVRWTFKFPGEDPAWYVAHVNETETHDGEAWVIDDILPHPEPGSIKVRVVRFDGRYRSRDDGMRGF